MKKIHLISFLCLLFAAFVQPLYAESSDLSSVQLETKVNLNTADVEQLQRELKGVGSTKAKAIVDYREAHGPFVSVDELLEVKGIGASILEKNRNKLALD